MQSHAAEAVRRTRRWWRRLSGALVMTLVLAGGVTAPLAAWQPPATTAAQDGFVPVDESKAQEHLPAAPLLFAAYAVAWIAVFVYVWTLWSRLSKVEREIADVSRRVEAGSRR
jgi:CcmD family protein